MDLLNFLGECKQSRNDGRLGYCLNFYGFKVCLFVFFLVGWALTSTFFQHLVQFFLAQVDLILFLFNLAEKFVLSFIII